MNEQDKKSKPAMALMIVEVGRYLQRKRYKFIRLRAEVIIDTIGKIMYAGVGDYRSACRAAITFWAILIRAQQQREGADRAWLLDEKGRPLNHIGLEKYLEGLGLGLAKKRLKKDVEVLIRAEILGLKTCEIACGQPVSYPVSWLVSCGGKLKKAGAHTSRPINQRIGFKEIGNSIPNEVGVKEKAGRGGKLGGLTGPARRKIGDLGELEEGDLGELEKWPPGGAGQEGCAPFSERVAGGEMIRLGDGQIMSFYAYLAAHKLLREDPKLIFIDLKGARTVVGEVAVGRYFDWANNLFEEINFEVQRRKRSDFVGELNSSECRTHGFYMREVYVKYGREGMIKTMKRMVEKAWEKIHKEGSIKNMKGIMTWLMQEQLKEKEQQNRSPPVKRFKIGS